MLQRQLVPMFSIRTEEGTRDRMAMRAIQMVQRWNPPVFDHVQTAKGIVNAPAIRALNGLADGAPIGLDAMQTIVDALVEAKAFYATEPEPFEGRNAEAIGDMDAMLEACAEVGVAPTAVT